MKVRSMLLMVSLLVTGALAPAVTQAGEFRFPIGITYVSGAQKVLDALKDEYNVSSDVAIPVGLAFNPYYESDIGLGLGASVGPFTILSIDAGQGTNTSVVIPVGADLRYAPFNKSSVSPYIRAGFRYPIATGDYLKTKSAGAIGGVGVEFMRTKKVSLGFELSYDSSKVTVKAGLPPAGAQRSLISQDIRPCGFMAGVFVVF